MGWGYAKKDTNCIKDDLNKDPLSGSWNVGD
jgi:hypothetical protein